MRLTQFLDWNWVRWFSMKSPARFIQLSFKTNTFIFFKYNGYISKFNANYLFNILTSPACSLGWTANGGRCLAVCWRWPAWPLANWPPDCDRTVEGWRWLSAGGLLPDTSCTKRLGDHVNEKKYKVGGGGVSGILLRLFSLILGKVIYGNVHKFT